MPLVSTRELLYSAMREGYGVPAFNAENMEMVLAIVEAAEEERSPVIIQTTPSTIRYAGCDMYFANVWAAAERASVPVAMHLDHGDSFQLAMRALRSGYTSIMIDGSALPFDENVALSRRVAEACHACSVPVEAELGRVGGKEDGIQGEDNNYTDPAQAAQFVELTGVDFLAVGIGTAHGVYKGEPKLDLDKLSQIRAAVEIPLVIHGTSGIAADVVRELISRGISKVNYATDLRIAYTRGVRAVLDSDKSLFDPKKYGMGGRREVFDCARGCIRLCGSHNRA